MSATADRDWPTQNQECLMSAVDRVRAALERYLGRDETPAGESGPEESCSTADPPGTRPSSLDVLVEMFGLSPFESDLLVLCAGTELDAGFAELCREAGNRPTFSLALAALPGAHWSALTPAAQLRYWKMIEVGPGDALMTAPLRIDERILHYLAGASYTDERLQGITSSYRAAGELPAAHRAVADRIAALWASSETSNGIRHPLQLVGEEDSGIEDVAAAACALQGLGMRIIRARDIPTSANDRDVIIRLWQREAALTNSGLLLVVNEVEQPETLAAAAAFVDRSHGALLLAGREPLRLPGQTLPRFDIRKPSGRQQADVWRRSLEPLSQRMGLREATGAFTNVQDQLNEQIDRLVNQFNFGPAAIAIAGAIVNRSEEVDPQAAGALLWETCRSQARSRLDDLAQRIETLSTWDDLVLPDLQVQILRDIVTHVRQRVQVYDRWGFAAKSSRGLGISALFAGASGTGKTLAAEIMANELRMDLYRIDLSQVVSKYIGETEKNLRRVFDAAETAGAVLLFDEADALFGKRSEVKDSHDRYANIEVSYLLQRMETYRGLAILTTNMKQALDPAFARRIRFVVQFPFPSAAERAEIWRRIFPAATPTAGLDVARLARLNVAGGNIRNIALGAAFIAADEGCVGMSHLLRAARAEYAKLDRPLTDGEIAGWV